MIEPAKIYIFVGRTTMQVVEVDCVEQCKYCVHHMVVCVFGTVTATW